MRPATPQDRDTGVPLIARLAAWAAVCAAIGAVSVVLILVRPCSAQETEGEIVLAAAQGPTGDVAAGPPSAAPPAADPRAALDRAARRALAEPLADRRGRREYAGVIYRTAAGYGHTPPQRSRTEGGFSLRLRPGVDLPRDAEVVALYHTHPRAAGRRADAHSPHDVEVARELGLVSFLGVVATGEVRRYDPAARPQAPAGYPRGAHVGDLAQPTQR